jgi:two-component sensor histidine kinase
VVGPAYVDLTFAPSVDLISHVRRFVARFYEAFLPQDDVGQRIALATHELLENAVKYGADGVTSLRIDLTDRGQDLLLRIAVRNKANEVNIAALRESVLEMSQCADAETYYHQVITRSVKTRGNSGLGLSRIHAEAGMGLDLSADGEGHVTVIASTSLRKDAS